MICVEFSFLCTCLFHFIFCWLWKPRLGSGFGWWLGLLHKSVLFSVGKKDFPTPGLFCGHERRVNIFIEGGGSYCNCTCSNLFLPVLGDETLIIFSTTTKITIWRPWTFIVVQEESISIFREELYQSMFHHKARR